MICPLRVMFADLNLDIEINLEDTRMTPKSVIVALNCRNFNTKGETFKFVKLLF